MKICILSHEYQPFPGGGIATYHDAAASRLARAGHEVHVVTNNAWYGRTEPHLTQRLWREGGLTVHRLFHFDEKRNPARDARFFDVNPANYGGPERLWAADPSNIAAFQAAAYVEQLHADEGLDVIEAPEYFAEAFYILRRRRAGRRGVYPPVCIHGHTSSRLAFATNLHTWELGYLPHRQMMLREEYCVQHADALLTPSRSLLEFYRTRFQDKLPRLQAVIPYFLELPQAAGRPPSELEGGPPYLLLLGRIEPRKGSDLALRAFALLAREFPDLRLVFLGREIWHEGESFDQVLQALITTPLRNRILRLGNVPRDQALAAARGAAALLHPAPWDNYPCAVLEAMSVGAACIVSDSGGQAEMVVDGESGLHFQANSPESLAISVRRVLGEPSLGERLGLAARERVAGITDPERLLSLKIRLFEAMLEAEGERDRADALVLPPFLDPGRILPPLQGSGTIFLDAGAADPQTFETTAAALLRELRGANDWRVSVFLEEAERPALPSGWHEASRHQAPPWIGLAPEDLFIYLLAGTRVEPGTLASLVELVAGSPIPCGGFCWLRPAAVQVFPYPPDLSAHDLLIGGTALPVLFAVPARYLQGVRTMAGLLGPEHRICALMAAAATAGDLIFRHTGEVCGDFYKNLPVVDRGVQQRAAGLLDASGLLHPGATQFGSTDSSVAPPAPAAPQAAAAPAQPSAPPAPQVTPERLAELEQAWREQQTLKQMKAVRLLRKLRVFDLLRRLSPRMKRAIGPGQAR